MRLSVTEHVKEPRVHLAVLLIPSGGEQVIEGPIIISIWDPRIGLLFLILGHLFDLFFCRTSIEYFTRGT